MSNLDVLRSKAVVVSQGTVIAQADGECFLLMFPDGSVVGAKDKQSAQRKATHWFKKQALPSFGIGVGTIEWRGE